MREEGRDGAQRAQHDADAEGIAAALRLARSDGTAGAAQEVGADKIAPDAPDGPEEERDTRGPRFDGELEEIAMGVGEVDAAGQEGGWLETEVDVLVRAESDTQHRE